uniref:hypothetical protein n=1 Tax=Rhodococcus tibetensis TaxID=2965064 RepID=UPI00272E1107
MRRDAQPEADAAHRDGRGDGEISAQSHVAYFARVDREVDRVRVAFEADGSAFDDFAGGDAFAGVLRDIAFAAGAAFLAEAFLAAAGVFTGAFFAEPGALAGAFSAGALPVPCAGAAPGDGARTDVAAVLETGAMFRVGVAAFDAGAASDAGVFRGGEDVTDPELLRTRARAALICRSASAVPPTATTTGHSTRPTAPTAAIVATAVDVE